MASLMRDELRAIADRVLMTLHREAMSARDVEDLLRFLRIFYYTMVDQMQEEQTASERGGHEYSAEDARGWEGKFQSLLTAFDAAKQAIARIERAPFEVEGKAEFHEAEVELRGMLSVPVERLLRAAESVTRGRGRTIGEVRDALQRKLHA